MRRIIPFFILLTLSLTGCGQSVSYEQGRQMADQTYGSMPPGQMMQESQSIMQQVQGEIEKAENKREWWNGFCDRGEEIWLERIEAMNKAMGQTVFKPGQIEAMFNQMRASYRE